MIRITVAKVNGAELLKVEGRVAGPWVQELADAAEESLRRSSDLQLDLAAVSFVDADGSRLLRVLHRRGAEVRTCSRFVAELLGWDC